MVVNKELKQAIALIRNALTDPDAKVDAKDLTELMALCQQLYGREFERNGNRHIEEHQ
jgi:hypothetical protein